MEDFKLGLNSKYKKIEEEIIEYNQLNTNNGDLKLDVQNFKEQYDLVEICPFTETKKKLKIKGTIGSPESGIIPINYKKRKNTLDALGIKKEDQNKLLEKCNGNLGKVLYLLFKAFMKHGTSVETFYTKLLGIQNYNQKDDSQNNSFFSFLYNLNPFKSKYI